MRPTLALLALVAVAAVCLVVVEAIPPIVVDNYQLDAEGDFQRRVIRARALTRPGDLGEKRGFIVHSVLAETAVEDDTINYSRNSISFAFDGRKGSRFGTNAKLRPRVAFASYSGSAEIDAADNDNLSGSGTSNAFAMYVRPFQIVLYVDTDGDGKYSPEERYDDPADPYFPLGDLDFSCSHDNYTVGDNSDAVAHVFTCVSDGTTGVDNVDGTGVVTIRYTATGVPLKYQGVELSPDTLKVDLGIDNFPYPAAAPSNVRLGLLALTVTGERQRPFSSAGSTDDDDADAIVADASGLEGGIIWDRSCTADGADINVGTTKLGAQSGEGDFGGQWTAEGLVWSFMADKPTNLYWDPSVGIVGTDSTNTGGIGLIPIIIGGVIFVALVAAAVGFYIRSKGSSPAHSKV